MHQYAAIKDAAPHGSVCPWAVKVTKSCTWLELKLVVMAISRKTQVQICQNLNEHQRPNGIVYCIFLVAQVTVCMGGGIGSTPTAPRTMIWGGAGTTPKEHWTHKRYNKTHLW